MILLGVILLVIGILLGIRILTVVGAVLLGVGLILLLAGTAGPMGGRWY